MSNPIKDKLDAAGIKIYKVRAIVMHHTKRDGWQDDYRKEPVIIDHLDRAMEVYKSLLNEVSTWTQYSKYKGRCELFEAHVHENGEVAYYPVDQETYIARWDSEERES